MSVNRVSKGDTVLSPHGSLLVWHPSMTLLFVVSQQLLEGIGGIGLLLQHFEQLFVRVDVGLDQPDGLIDNLIFFTITDILGSTEWALENIAYLQSFYFEDNVGKTSVKRFSAVWG